MQRTDIAARFKSETTQHQMRILQDSGTHRHLRFMNPKDSAYWFEIVTWPGSLTLRGDLNDAYTFTRLTDMFEFFRGKRINPHYWAEKLAGGRDQVMEFSEDVFRQTVKDQVVSDIQFADAPRGIGRAVRQQILNAEVYDRESAIELVETFDFKGYEFGETWEWDLRDYDWSFLWACHAIVWGIQQYDQHRRREAELLLAALPSGRKWTARRRKAARRHVIAEDRRSADRELMALIRHERIGAGR